MLSDRNVLSDSSLKGRRRRMRTRACIIRKDSKAGRYFSDICCKSKALRNTTNFYIRNSAIPRTSTSATRIPGS